MRGPAAVRAAAESLADGAMYNGGQSCCSVERIYVHTAVERPFLEAFVEVVNGMKLGDPEDKATYIGPLARREQLDVLDAQVADAAPQPALDLQLQVFRRRAGRLDDGLHIHDHSHFSKTFC